MFYFSPMMHWIKYMISPAFELPVNFGYTDCGSTHPIPRNKRQRWKLQRRKRG